MIEKLQMDEQRFSPRDWVLLPLLSILTVIAVIAPTEGLARWAFSTWRSGDASMIEDPSIGEHALPNSAYVMKGPESIPVTYAFNSCGHRAGMECGPKPPGAYRIVMVGSSVAYGLFIPREKTFGALIPNRLNQMTGSTIQLYNEALPAGRPHTVDLQLGSALNAEPDMILWPITPYDIQHEDRITNSGITKENGGLWKTLGDGLTEDHSRAFLAIRHYLYEDPNYYLEDYLKNGESSAFLKSSLDPFWKQRLSQLAVYASDIAARARAARVPLFVVLIPDRAQATMLSQGHAPQGYNPYAIGEDIKSIMERVGVTYLDILPGFTAVPQAQRCYFPVDGHINIEGHALVSRLIAKSLSERVEMTPSNDRASVLVH